MDIEQFRKAGYAAVDRICDYYASIESRPVVSQVEPGHLGKLLPDRAPEQGEPFEKIADDFQSIIMPGITHWQHPSFFAYFPSIATFEGMLADLYASSVGNPGFNWACSPACTELEAVVMDWSARLLALDETFISASGVGGGVIQTTASDAALTAVVAARSHYSDRHPTVPFEKLVIYGTTQTHSLGAKAALVLGLRFRALTATQETSFGLTGETLKVALKEDIDAGFHPFILIATVGTTSSGAIDRLDELAFVAQEYPSLWIHVDAAWAGVAFACPEYRAVGHLDSINRYAHSFCTNFHKWGLTNFDASAFWVRDRKLLTDALDVTPEFLRTKHGDSGTVIDYRNWHLALGRRFRSLKFWFVLRSFGAEGFRAHIRKGIKLANILADLIKAAPIFSLVVPPSFSLVVFRLVPATSSQPPSDEQLNSLNRAFHQRILHRPDIYLTQTDLGGIFCIRMSTGVLRTEERHILQAFTLLKEEGEKALEEWSKSFEH